MLLSAEHLSKNYGMKQLLQDVSLYLQEGDHVGIIGINGTGKSTLLRILAGAEEPDEGTVSRNPNVQISFLPQNPVMDDNATALEQVLSSFSPEVRAPNEYEAKSMLSRLGIPDFHQKVGTLSGGQRKRVALVAALLLPADILVLDEPTNHLDSEMVTWLEQKLARYPGGVVMVTHDRYFLTRVVNKIVELDHAKLYTYEANYAKYLELKAERMEMAEASERKRQSILRREYQWVMRGARARGTKSKERLARYEALKNQDAPPVNDTLQVSAVSSRLGKKIIELEHISKSFDGKTVLSDFSYGILRGDRIGIVGHNGVGKSTLLNLIAGRLAPDTGSVETGSTVRIGFFTQEGREMNLNQRVFDFINDIASEIKTADGTFSSSQMLERFLFPSDLQYSLIGRLSGGERRRLYLLSILMEAPNLLLLDEPTNDMDVETLTILEDYLETFPGPVLAVSHDRYFLDKISTSIFEVRAGGQILRYNGNYADYLDQRTEPEEAKNPPAREPVKNRPSALPRPQKLRFSFKEQREFETIDDEIAALEQQIADTDAEIAKAGSDYTALQELIAKKETLSAQLEEKTERWCYLNDLAEKIAAQKEGSL